MRKIKCVSLSVSSTSAHTVWLRGGICLFIFAIYMYQRNCFYSNTVATVTCLFALKVEVKSAYEPSGSSGRSLSQFQ